MDLKPEITIDDFAKVDLRVATVREAKPHPNADRLLVLQVDLGDGETRQICAGIKAFYEPDALVGKQIVVVANLAPATTPRRDEPGHAPRGERGRPEPSHPAHRRWRRFRRGRKSV